VKTISPFILVIAILGTVATGALYYRAAGRSQSLQIQLAASQVHTDQLAHDLAKNALLSLNQQARLEAMDLDLASTKTRLTATEAKRVQLVREMSQLREQLASAQSSEAQLTEVLTQSRDSLARLTRELDTLRPSPPPALSPAEPASLAVLTTSRARTASVVSIGPGNAFVVINFGAAQGALPTQTMTIKRGTESIATVLITDVRKNYSIAHVRPDTLRGTLQKGDSAIIAY